MTNTESTPAITVREVAGEVREVFARLAGMPGDTIDTRRPLAEMGLNAIIVLRAREEFERNYGVRLEVGQLLDLGTVDQVARYLEKRCRETGRAPSAPSNDRRAGLAQHLPETSNTSSSSAEYLGGFIRHYTDRTKRSKLLAQQHRLALADRRGSTGFRPAIKELIYPIAAARSQGSRFWDIDGNEYLDLVMGFGTLLFGHRPAFLIDAIRRQVKKGIHVGPQAELAGDVAELICELSGMERAAFTVTGSEAVMTTLRLARARTGRSKVALFQGSWHGGYDATLLIAGSGGRSVPVMPGITQRVADDGLVLEYGDRRSLETLQARGGELAAVLVEPVQSGRPSLQPKEFLQEVRAITSRTGTALIFDEMITGFRVHLGGAQARFGVRADLAIFGKAVSGGLPVGVVAGRPTYLDLVDGGFWKFGDDSAPDEETTWVGSTHGKHPLSMAAAHAVLSELKRDGGKTLELLNRRCGHLVEALNTYFTSTGVPISVAAFGSMFRFEGRCNMALFFYHLVANGLYVTDSNRVCFLSTAHTDRDVEIILHAVRRSVEEMKGGGLLRQ